MAGIGTIVASMSAEVDQPPNETWLPCDGREVSRGDYQAFYTLVGDAYGSGDKVSTFNLPDLRGRFIRGLDVKGVRDVDCAFRTAMNPGGNAGAQIGALEPDAFTSHDHALTGVVYPDYDTFDNVSGFQPDATQSAWGATDDAGGSETRPKNISAYFIIRLA